MSSPEDSPTPNLPALALDSEHILVACAAPSHWKHSGHHTPCLAPAQPPAATGLQGFRNRVSDPAQILLMLLPGQTPSDLASWGLRSTTESEYNPHQSRVSADEGRKRKSDSDTKAGYKQHTKDNLLRCQVLGNKGHTAGHSRTSSS